MAEENKDVSTVSVESISESIFLLRGQKVMLDFSLAELYGVQTKTLNQAVRRNRDRFPGDLRSQIVTLKHGHNIKYLPYAFTEQGVAMLSSAFRNTIKRLLKSSKPSASSWHHRLRRR